MRWQYFAWDESLWRNLLQRQQLEGLFWYAVTAAGGDVDRALQLMQDLQRRGLLPPEIDLDALRDQLESDGDIVGTPQGGFSLAKKGEKALRRAAFEQIFGRMRRSGQGQHRTPRIGGAGELEPETRRWRPGEDPGRIDYGRSFRNALRRYPGPLRLREDDLEVRERHQQSHCSTVLLLDISHSMILYGEDRITPAKQVALALVELLRQRYPKDTLDVILFGNEAIPVPLDQLPYVEVGPYHTNTRAALQAARRVLRRRKHANKQVILITDGKPTVLTGADGEIYRNTFGLDPKIVNKTLDEAVALRREGIPITTFMIASDPYLQEFVHQLSERNRGKAYFSEPGKLGEFVLVDFLRNRRGRIR